MEDGALDMAIIVLNNGGWNTKSNIVLSGGWNTKHDTKHCWWWRIEHEIWHPCCWWRIEHGTALLVVVEDGTQHH